MTRENASLIWFRNDLRLGDHPALHAAVASGKKLYCLYILETNAAHRPQGAASRWWLHHTLHALESDLAALGGRLCVLKGDSETILPELCQTLGIDEVHWGRRYAPAERETDTRLKTRLAERSVTVTSHNSSLLFEPWQLKPASGAFYKVFTPFWRAALQHGLPEHILPQPKSINGTKIPEELRISDLDLLPRNPDWATGFTPLWRIGEQAALQRLQSFMKDGLQHYATLRDSPAAQVTSRLSPHLRFGEISPRQIAQAIGMAERNSLASSKDCAKFLAELGWREFSYHLLFHTKNLAEHNVQTRFDAFPWHEPQHEFLRAWQRGRTGYPLVDAGMRELWHTGTMHNRVRMVVASFLIKHGMQHWQFGENWFWDTLVDADPASNPASWQWVAGAGADAAPYYRIFNPIIQSQKFDPDGAYLKKWLPELARLDATSIHAPWRAAPEHLLKAGIILGKTYPAPIIDHDFARQRALAAFQALPQS